MIQFRREYQQPSQEQLAYGVRPGSRFTLGYLDEHERSIAVVATIDLDLVQFQIENRQGEVITTIITQKVAIFRAAILAALLPISADERKRRGYDIYTHEHV